MPVFPCKYNHEEAEKDLNWASKFWKKEGEAIPTQNPNKCKTCEYNEKCGCLCPRFARAVVLKLQMLL